jgi:hypothetical protein
VLTWLGIPTRIAGSELIATFGWLALAEARPSEK